MRTEWNPNLDAFHKVTVCCLSLSRRLQSSPHAIDGFWNNPCLGWTQKAQHGRNRPSYCRRPLFSCLIAAHARAAFCRGRWTRQRFLDIFSFFQFGLIKIHCSPQSGAPIKHHINSGLHHVSSSKQVPFHEQIFFTNFLKLWSSMHRITFWRWIPPDDCSILALLHTFCHTDTDAVVLTDSTAIDSV